MDYEGFLHGEMLGVLVTHLELSFELFCFCFVRAQRPSINVKLMLQSITLKVIFHSWTCFFGSTSQVRRERISERLKHLQALIPDGDKVCTIFLLLSIVFVLRKL
jgi:hypothetical protein